MERITLPLEVKQLSGDDNTFTFEGHLAAFDNVDHDGDVIIKGAFSDWLSKSIEENKETIPIFWAHKSGEPVGVFPIKNMKEDNFGLSVKGIMPKDDTFVSGRVIPQMRIGSVKKMSIGYRIKDYDFEENVRVLKSIALWEGSLVTLPANDNATITSFKSITPYGDLPLASRDRPWDADAAIGRLREWAGVNGDDGSLSDPDVQARYKQAFFWYEEADSDLLMGYKLPFADIINDELKAVPRGIFSAAGVLRGARGGVYIPRDERPGVVRNVEKYYEKMGLESPFGKSFRIDDLSCIDERNLEKILKSGVSFSNKMSKTLISVIKQAGLREVEKLQRDADNQKKIMEALEEVMNKIKRSK